jgi:hypothetical protein
MLISEIKRNKPEKKIRKILLTGGSLSTIIRRGNYVVKYYNGSYSRGYEKLRKEIKYLNKLPTDIKPLFPKLISVEEKEGYLGYTMPFYHDFYTISDLIFSERNIEDIWKIFLRSLKLADKLFYSSKIKKVPKNYIKKTHFSRIKSSLDFFNNSIDYKEILAKKEIILNGERLINLPFIISMLKRNKEWRDFLTPKKLTLFHGNFHTDNILVNKQKTLFIDPRGEYFGSEEYDKAKMFIHFFLEYDEIHSNKFNLFKNKNIFRISMKDKRIQKRYFILQKKFIQHESKQWKNKKEFMLKIASIGAIHALSFASYHARKKNPNKKRVLAYYLGATKMFNNLIDPSKLNLKERAFNNN